MKLLYPTNEVIFCKNYAFYRHKIFRALKHPTDCRIYQYPLRCTSDEIAHFFHLSYFYLPQTKFAKVMFLQVSVCPRGACLVAGGGMHGCGGACMVVGGCMVAGGACVVVGEGGVCGCGGHAWLWGACMVAGGHVWLAGACMVVGGLRGI